MSSRTGLPTRLDFQANTEIALLDAYAMVQPGEAHDLIQANSDIEAAAIWLTTTATNLKTRRVMRKEVERFILWALHTRGKQLSQINVMDVSDYATFLADPQPREVWVSETKYPRHHEQWRPFAGPLSLSSQRYALMQIGSMYTWMVKGGRLKGNPVALVRKPQAPHDPTIKRLLPEEGIALAFEAINLTKSPRKRARDHFMLSLFYLTGVRTFEGTTSNMSSIHRSASGTWWLNVLGKRNKIRDVPISDELYQDLQLYREAFGLPRDIPSKDPTPLLLAANSKLKRAHTSTVLKAIIAIMTRAAGLAVQREQFDLADRLADATTHWLRHSCFSHLAKATGDLVMIKSLAGHSKMETTSRYLHSEDDELHAGVVQTLSTPRLK
ncbi:integrase (plasmid) [Pseudomonas veronii 1YdBTEX2]|uniref:Tyrosine-type recombinase/integrase n=2 Tax=Pseudomonas veronii TaxID=76761 RepID=A0A7Y1FDP6_PSEVE|nr:MULTISPECIES: tyrosine-type recombinase/integrase [Pseudomonas]SBW85382.1 integrase [Pseudomonas veronii 1YdBTEX2]KAA0945875.1 tyrosine-type recombinase/integrase [Pseudomonas sp. ANT_H14]KAA0946326.1 tyrosine-type recombinase/integrase [Pseudomonas sp. ANT_H4]MBI6556745.1 tyrosine-type recombinase/integrase [Pseudomonas veronii]MBI6653570.1 tyrosine-type recombinase/integrase [Pseudomonas veronii]